MIIQKHQFNAIIQKEKILKKTQLLALSNRFEAMLPLLISQSVFLFPHGGNKASNTPVL